MTITAGVKLGPYEVLEPLGAGGMGEVYKARDTRLEREVAIKVLPQHLSSNPDQKARFEREARAISALNHPHICHLYDIGTQDGSDYLVMELLEGETLGARLQKGALPLKQSLEYGMQIAEALERAHRSGIVHRDLKPGNIMLTKNGAKLMDFGLAKPTRSMAAMASATAETMSKPLTGEGTIVGTYQYMAPEQVLGQSVDARSDIFALGAVLYEMVTGKRAFAGKSQISVMSAILEKEPEPVTASQPLTPPALDHVIQRALAKDAEERWQSAADLRAELRWIAEGGSGSAAGPAMIPGKRRGERRAWMVAGAALAVAIALAALYFARPAAPAYQIRSLVPAPENAPFIFVGDNAGPPVISPDGRNLAFVAAPINGAQQIYVRPLASAEAVALAGTENAWAPFWSPDGKKIGFFADGQLKTIELQGGMPVALAAAANGRGGSWGRDGTIVFAPDFRSGLYRAPAAGGTAVAVTKVDESKHTSHRWPFFLPDGKHFLYLAVNHQAARDPNDGIYYASLDGRQNTRLLGAFTNPQYAEGMLLYVRDGTLVARTLDADTGVLKDDEQTVATGVSEDGTTWRAAFAVYGNRLLAYAAGAQLDTQLTWYDRSGKPLGRVGEKIGSLANGDQELRLSPTGDRVALSIQGAGTDIWVADLARGVRSRLSFGPTGNLDPVWSPDGKWLAYMMLTRQDFALARRPAAGGTEETLLLDKELMEPQDWSRDGKYLLYVKGPLGGERGIWALPLAGGQKPFQVFSSGPFRRTYPRLSPDGHWLAYQSDESGRREVYVTRFGAGSGGGKWQVSPTGGFAPLWRSDEREIFYIALDGMLTSVPVTATAGSLKLGVPKPLFRTSTTTYDVAAGGQKFLMDVAGDQTSKPITLVTDWMAEIKK